MPGCCVMSASWVAPGDISGRFQSVLGELDYTGWVAQKKFWKGLGNQHSTMTNCESVRPGNDEMRSSEVWPWRSCSSTYQKLLLAVCERILSERLDCWLRSGPWTDINLMLHVRQAMRRWLTMKANTVLTAQDTDWVTSANRKNLLICLHHSPYSIIKNYAF